MKTNDFGLFFLNLQLLIIKISLCYLLFTLKTPFISNSLIQIIPYCFGFGYIWEYVCLFFRAMEDASQSPNRADNSSTGLALSASTSSPRAASTVLLPGLESLQV